MTAPAHDFMLLLGADRDELLANLAETHTLLANLHEEIAYNRAMEKGNQSAQSARITLEGTRDAFIEKKFLIVRLLDGK